MNLIERTFKGIERRRQKILDGGINSIPSPFIRFSSEFIGVEQQKYYVVTANAKVGKTQITSFLFLYTPLLYAYEHPEQIRVKFFYYPLEETPEDVTRRFMSFILNKYKGIRVSPTDLMSSANKPLSDTVLEALQDEEIKKILSFYESHVEFSASRNPTGVNKEVEKYMRDNGTVHWKKVHLKDNITGQLREVNAFDYYEPNDPDEYVIVIVDHISLIQPERSMTLKQSADKLSEYCVALRNDYGVTPVIVQQQTADKEGLDSFKERKLRPDASGLADTKYTGRDTNVLLGLFNPFKYELPEYMGYDITKLRGNARFLEVILNRGGVCGGLIGLYFDGETCTFAELPKPTETQQLLKVYAFIKSLKEKKSSVFLLLHSIKKKFRK